MSAGKVHFVAVSRWLADMARSASLMRGHDVTVIPNVLSLSHFRMSDRLDSRSMLSIRARHVVIFGAARIDIPIKGFGYLKSALAYMTTRMGYSPDDLHLILFGSVRSSEALDGIPVPYTHMGHVTDEETLSQLYSASDVLVSSSLYETFGQTIMRPWPADALRCRSITAGRPTSYAISRTDIWPATCPWKILQPVLTGLSVRVCRVVT